MARGISPGVAGRLADLAGCRVAFMAAAREEGGRWRREQTRSDVVVDSAEVAGSKFRLFRGVCAVPFSPADVFAVVGTMERVRWDPGYHPDTHVIEAVYDAGGLRATIVRGRRRRRRAVAVHVTPLPPAGVPRHQRGAHDRVARLLHAVRDGRDDARPVHDVRRIHRGRAGKYSAGTWDVVARVCGGRGMGRRRGIWCGAQGRVRAYNSKGCGMLIEPDPAGGPRHSRVTWVVCARRGATAASSASRAGLCAPQIHSELQGWIPAMVVNAAMCKVYNDVVVLLNNAVRERVARSGSLAP